jgi:hypothetical protein
MSIEEPGWPRGSRGMDSRALWWRRRRCPCHAASLRCVHLRMTNLLVVTFGLGDMKCICLRDAAENIFTKQEDVSEIEYYFEI